MNLKEKHTGKFLVLIAGIIILAHSVIPHHHHFDSVEAHSDNLQCETTNSKGHNEIPDTHCHALNIIVSEKTSDILANSSTVSYSHFELFNIESKQDLALYTNDFVNIGYSDVSLQNPRFLTNHQLRAPPTSV